MLKFFRRIRKTILADGATTKYMLYAAGEIALVVIGILIALQINNWNERRKDRQIEQTYLQNLKEELSENKEICLSRMKIDEFQSDNAHLLIKVMNEDTILEDLEPMLVAIEHVGRQRPLSYLIQNVWEELHSTGHITLFQNQELKKELTHTYRQMNFMLGFTSEWNSYNAGARDLMRGMFSSHLSIAIRSKLRPSEYIGDLETTEEFEQALEKLKQLTDVEGFLVDIYNTRQTSAAFFSELIDRIDSSITIIDGELE